MGCDLSQEPLKPSALIAGSGRTDALGEGLTDGAAPPPAEGCVDGRAAAASGLALGAAATALALIGAGARLTNRSPTASSAITMIAGRITGRRRDGVSRRRDFRVPRIPRLYPDVG